MSLDPTMPPDEALRRLNARLDAVKEDIRPLPLPEKFRLVADFIEAGEAVAPGLVTGLARHALSELEKLS